MDGPNDSVHAKQPVMIACMFWLSTSFIRSGGVHLGYVMEQKSPHSSLNDQKHFSFFVGKYGPLHMFYFELHLQTNY